MAGRVTSLARRPGRWGRDHVPPASSLSRAERGTVSAFVVSLAFACLLAGGLALDGGRIVVARIEVADVAAAAARAGAQELVGLRAGDLQIEPSRARAAATAVLSFSPAIDDEVSITSTMSAPRLVSLAEQRLRAAKGR